VRGGFSLHDEHAISAFIPFGESIAYQGRGVERLMEIADEMEKPAVGDRPVSGPRIARQDAPAIGNGLGDVPLMEIAAGSIARLNLTGRSSPMK